MVKLLSQFIVAAMACGSQKAPPVPRLLPKLERSAEPAQPGQAAETRLSSRQGFALERHRMVEKQLRAPGRGLTNAAVLEAMTKVPRHEFVPAGSRQFAYDDTALPIGFDQTISQPFIVAFMTEKLEPQPKDRVLEIGTGSGYQAAVLSRLVAQVYSIEILEALGRRAANDLKRLGYTNVFVMIGDGSRGWPEKAPFDKIIVTCAPDHIPQPLVRQLKDGGRMIIPVGPPFAQNLYLLEKHGQELKERAVLPVRFVPMTRRGK